MCADELGGVSAPGDLVVVDTTGSALDHGVPNDWPDPVVLYRADRRGRSLAADQLDPAKLAADRQAGARLFVDVDPSLVPAGRLGAKRDATADVGPRRLRHLGPGRHPVTPPAEKAIRERRLQWRIAR